MLLKNSPFVIDFFFDFSKYMKNILTGADPGFQVRGAHLKKNCAELREARKLLGYFV